MPRLRRSQCGRAAIVRRRHGRGFSYRWSTGEPVTAADRERIRALAIPPAWTDVWICPWPNGHIQATGVDAAGRRQYRYHDEWHRQRGREKFDRVLAFARGLPDTRAIVEADLRLDGMPRERVVATTVRLLDIGCFRIGGEVYAEEHETYGVASLLREHVSLAHGAVTFDYPAKGSLQRTVSVRDDEVRAVISALTRRRGGPPELFAFRQGKVWTPVRSDDVNAYIKAAAGEGYSAKDFRTWSATVLAAAGLAAVDPVPTSERGRRRALAGAVATVAEQLGNTPTVCRSSYIDPRVIDRFSSGETIRDSLSSIPDHVTADDVAVRHRLERAVIDLIAGDDGLTQAA